MHLPISKRTYSQKNWNWKAPLNARISRKTHLQMFPFSQSKIDTTDFQARDEAYPSVPKVSPIS